MKWSLPFSSPTPVINQTLFIVAGLFCPSIISKRWGVGPVQFVVEDAGSNGELWILCATIMGSWNTNGSNAEIPITVSQVTWSCQHADSSKPIGWDKDAADSDWPRNHGNWQKTKKRKELMIKGSNSWAREAIYDDIWHDSLSDFSWQLNKEVHYFASNEMTCKSCCKDFLTTGHLFDCTMFLILSWWRPGEWDGSSSQSPWIRN